MLDGRAIETITISPRRLQSLWLPSPAKVFLPRRLCFESEGESEYTHLIWPIGQTHCQLSQITNAYVSWGMRNAVGANAKIFRSREHKNRCARHFYNCRKVRATQWENK